MKTWRDAELWADHADDAGVDCPICGTTVANFHESLGEAADLAQKHMAQDHGVTEQASILVLVSPELVAQMTEGKWSAPVQVTIDRLNVPGPSGETHMMTARTYPQAVDDGPTAKLASESLRRAQDAYNKAHAEESPKDQER